MTTETPVQAPAKPATSFGSFDDGLGKLPRHFVNLKPDGTMEDKAICGFVWFQRINKISGDLCPECAEELRRRGHA